MTHARAVRLFMLSMVFAAGLPASGRAADVPVHGVVPTLLATVTEPTSLAVRKNDGGIYITEKPGRIRVIRQGVLRSNIVLDISSEVVSQGERGLLGLAFSPDGTKLYVNFTDLLGDTHIREYAFSSGKAVVSSRRELIFLDQPFPNHNGGQLAFGPDGYLYIAVGDGGSGGDPLNHGQRLDVLFGKILRIDPRTSATLPYTIPPTNPFVGVPGARGEIWAYGLRNPWRFSFDKLTRDLWIGDVGQRSWEEIDFQSAGSAGGQNYGWRNMEGKHSFNNRPEPPNHVPPIWEYPHHVDTCSVTGGFVYRGKRITALQGVYLFADFCAGRIEGLVRTPAGAVAAPIGIRVPFPSTFGQDNAGELYVASLEGEVYRLDPVIVPA